jgi:hypothetical protein
MSWLLARVAGPLSAHPLDGAAFVVPPLEGLLAWIALTLGVLVRHDWSMRPIPRAGHLEGRRFGPRERKRRGEDNKPRMKLESGLWSRLSTSAAAPQRPSAARRPAPAATPKVEAILQSPDLFFDDF